MEEHADKVFVFDGTNDYGHGRLILGNPKQREEMTFYHDYHELQLLIEDLIEKYGKDKFCFILPLRRFDENGVCCKGKNSNERGEILSAYIDAMRYILKEYEIPFLDLYQSGGPKPLSCARYFYRVDGLHPNTEGHKLYADYAIKRIKVYENGRI